MDNRAYEFLTEIKTLYEKQFRFQYSHSAELSNRISDSLIKRNLH